jgi:hypothetical protein
MTSTSTPSVPQGEDTSAPPRRLQSLIIRGSGTPDVHVPSPPVGVWGRPPMRWRLGG